MDGLGAFNQLYGIGEILPQGDRFRVGFSVGWFLAGPDTGGGPLGPDWDYVKQVIEGCLYSTGAFNSLDISLDIGYLRTYILVQGSTAVQFANTEDVGGLIAGKINECLPSLSIERRDSVATDKKDTHGDTACPEGYRYVGWFSGCQPINPQVVDVPKTDKCKGLGFADWVSCTTGLTKENGLVIALAAGVIGAVVIGKAIK